MGLAMQHISYVVAGQFVGLHSECDHTSKHVTSHAEYTYTHRHASVACVCACVCV